MKLIHLINTFEPQPGSDLVRALPVTVASLRNAQLQAARHSIEVTLIAAAFQDEQHSVPDGFVAAPPLTRHSRDLPSLEDTPPLPLFRDLLTRLRESATSPDDFLIYTNSDIAVQPHFYNDVAAICATGVNSFTINRRTISDKYSGVADLPHMYADKGEPHPGADCFVFRARCLSSELFTDVIVGTCMFDKMLLWNLLTTGQPFRTFADLFLTFHLGDDRAWKRPAATPLKKHNRLELKRFLMNLEREHGPLQSHKALWRAINLRPNSRHTHLYQLLGFEPLKRASPATTCAAACTRAVRRLLRRPLFN